MNSLKTHGCTLPMTWICHPDVTWMSGRSFPLRKRRRWNQSIIRCCFSKCFSCGCSCCVTRCPRFNGCSWPSLRARGFLVSPDNPHMPQVGFERISRVVMGHGQSWRVIEVYGIRHCGTMKRKKFSFGILNARPVANS